MSKTITTEYSFNGFAGCVEQITSETGTLVGLYAGEQAGLDTDDGRQPWSTICETHGTIACHRTLALARRHLPTAGWCECCMGTCDGEYCACGREKRERAEAAAKTDAKTEPVRPVTVADFAAVPAYALAHLDLDAMTYDEIVAAGGATAPRFAASTDAGERALIAGFMTRLTAEWRQRRRDDDELAASDRAQHDAWRAGRL